MKNIENRREFLASMARYSLLAALGLGSGWKILQSVQSQCPANVLCDQCRELDRCEQPKALAGKKSSEMETPGHVR